MRPLTLTLERRWPRKGYTIGVLSCGSFSCNTLEDEVRAPGVKVYGQTAIPPGTYRLDMGTVSPKFRDRAWARLYGGIVPRLVDVPMFTGVLIHPGNTAADTDGCILVGRNTEVGKVTSSQATYRRLMDEVLMPARDAGREIKLVIK